VPPGAGPLYLGTVIASTCFGMIGVALGALARNTIGAIVAAIGWTLLADELILQTVAPGIDKWLPAGAAIGLTNPPARVMPPRASRRLQSSSWCPLPWSDDRISPGDSNSTAA